MHKCLRFKLTQTGVTMAYYIGLDIGGTKCAASLGLIQGDRLPTVVQKERFLTEGLTPCQVLERFAAFISQVLQNYTIEGIGISCGGPLDSKRGIIQSPPSLPQWKDIEIVRYFTERFGVPTYLQNDANACAVAEWKFGAGKGLQNMVFLTFGTGLGAGLILNGKLYSGTNDNAGEIGHVRLAKDGPLGYFKHGSCEGYCSGSGIKRLADIMSKRKAYAQSYKQFVDTVGIDNVSAQTLAQQANEGNRFCLAVYKKSGQMLGKTLSILVDVLNPEAIVIGGVYMRSGQLLYPHAIKEMQKECLSNSFECVKILPALLSENVGDIAALSVATGNF